MKLKTKKRALTLIELLVSITIMLIILAVSIPLFSSLQDKMLIRNQSQSVASMVQYLRSLNNNPANESRDGTSAPTYFLVVDMTNNKIYIKDQKGNEFDTLKLTKTEEMSVNFSDSSNNYSDGTLVFPISGKTPNDQLLCPTSPTTTCVVNSKMTISIKSKRYSDIGKNIVISNMGADNLQVNTEQ